MEYAYATCILNETNAEINEQNLTAVLEAAGADVQTSRVKAIVAALEAIDIDGVTSIELPEPDESVDEFEDGRADLDATDDFSAVEAPDETPEAREAPMDQSGDVADDVETTVPQESDDAPTPHSESEA